MPLCLPEYEIKEKHLENEDILLRMRYCSIYMCEEGQRILSSEPRLIDYTLSQSNETIIKVAYVKLGSVKLGWFSTSPEKGIYITTKNISPSSRNKVKWPSVDKLVDCDIEQTIQKEFGLDISRYL